MEESFGPGALDLADDPAACPSLRMTPRSKEALQSALRHAAGLGSPSIGTAHLLLGLTDIVEGPAGDILAVRVGRDAVRHAVLAELGVPDPPAPRGRRRRLRARG